MDINYKKLGFKCGLEVHQQIGTQKLFCRCPSIKPDSKTDYNVKRYLRSAAGETGEVDVAAKFETEKNRHFIYEGHDSSTCLIELDEAPPLPLNQEALEIGLQVALLLNAQIVDQIHFMRKTVVDGSNTSAFQRTALIAQDGFIQTEKGAVNIPSILNFFYIGWEINAYFHDFFC